MLIPKTGGGKRQLGIPTVEDKVVQQAIRSLLEPIYEASFGGSATGIDPGSEPTTRSMRWRWRSTAE